MHLSGAQFCSQSRAWGEVLWMMLSCELWTTARQSWEPFKVLKSASDMIKMAFQKGHSDNSKEGGLKGPDCVEHEAAAWGRGKAGVGVLWEWRRYTWRCWFGSINQMLCAQWMQYIFSEHYILITGLFLCLAFCRNKTCPYLMFLSPGKDALLTKKRRKYKMILNFLDLSKVVPYY